MSDRQRFYRRIKIGRDWKILGLFYLLCAVLMASLHGPIDERRGGLVMDLRGNPLKNASVEIYESDQTIPFESLLTDTNGCYRFHAPVSKESKQANPPIRIVVSLDGFETSDTLQNPQKVGWHQHQLVPNNRAFPNNERNNRPPARECLTRGFSSTRSAQREGEPRRKTLSTPWFSVFSAPSVLK